MAHNTKNFTAIMWLIVCNTSVQSPKSNGMAEGFIKTFKRYYVHANRLEKTQMLLEQLQVWFEDYNKVAAHKRLKMQSTREYRKFITASSECLIF